MNLRYNKELDQFERVEAFSIDAMNLQIQEWQGSIDAKNKEIDDLNKQIQELQVLIGQRG